jgi:hypothetical protein
MEWKRAEGL